MLRRLSPYKANLKMNRRDVHFLLFRGQGMFLPEKFPDLRKLGQSETYANKRNTAQKS